REAEVERREEREGGEDDEPDDPRADGKIPGPCLLAHSPPPAPGGRDGGGLCGVLNHGVYLSDAEQRARGRAQDAIAASTWCPRHGDLRGGPPRRSCPLPDQAKSISSCATVLASSSASSGERLPSRAGITPSVCMIWSSWPPTVDRAIWR